MRNIFIYQDGIFSGILSVPKNIVIDMNNVMLRMIYIQ